MSAFLLCLSLTATAQHTFRGIVLDAATGEPLPGVVMAIKGEEGTGAVSNDDGRISLQGLPDGVVTFVLHYLGYHDTTYTVTLPDTLEHTILLTADAHALHDVVVVASTRNNDRIEHATTKVEVLGPEEMHEESMVKPGNIASILGDISGVQIQQSSAASGNVNVRIQGLDGRYTQMLRDGMPLYDGFSGGFGILSIPPLDLKQLELIKGAASTLYGGGAIGGLLNFISKRPERTPDASFVLNQSTLKETNINGYFSQRGKRVGVTLFAGQTWQKEVDVDGDGLSDVPRLSSTLIHPTFFYYPSEKSMVSLGWSGSFDKRTGGDMQAIGNRNDPAHPYYEENKLQRHTLTLIAEHKFSGNITGTLKANWSRFGRDITTNTYRFTGNQQNFYGEASVLTRISRHNLIAGLNLTGDRFRSDDATPIPAGNLSNTTIGGFLQDTWQVLARTRLEGGLRVDHHDKYGTFVLPRLALFHRFDDHWGLRGGFGMGYKTPNPFTPQIKDYDLYAIRALPANIAAERSYGFNIEGNYRKQWDEEHTFFLNHAFFLTRIQDPVVGTEQADGTLAFANQDAPIVTKGFDTYVQMQLADWELYLGYTYTEAERKYLAQNQFMPLTPRNRAAATLVYEIPDKWRFGIEASYNGRQYRDGDSKTPDYFFVAAMVERKLGKKISIVLNGENLLDERQSNYERIYTGDITAPVYKPLWAPIDGRVINLALRFRPFEGK